MVARNTRSQRKRKSLTARMLNKSGIRRKTARVNKVKPANKINNIIMQSNNAVALRKTKKVKKVGLSYLKKARSFLDFLTRNAESFGEKKYTRHAMVASAIQEHLKQKNTLHEIGRNIDMDEENPFTFIDNLYNEIQDLFDEYDNEEDPDIKPYLEEQMVLLTVTINEAVGEGKAAYANFKKSKTPAARNQNMNNVQNMGSANNRNVANNNVNDLAAMLGKM
jgi:hypothetical protein